MSNYKYEGCGVIRDLKSDIPYHTDDIVDLLEEKDQQIKELEEENQKLKQAQKQVAIEELEFVLKNFRNRPAYFDIARQELCLSNQDKQFIDFINNRIKELKGVDIHA